MSTSARRTSLSPAAARAAIVGIGHTRYIKASDVTERRQAVDAIQAITDGAGRGAIHERQARLTSVSAQVNRRFPLAIGVSIPRIAIRLADEREHGQRRR
jgi:hypothetical protein